MRVDRRSNWWAGCLAGAMGGLAGSLVMSQFHALVQSGESPQQDQEDSTIKAAGAISQRIFHHELTPEEKRIAGPAVHYAFGATIACIYGGVVELAHGVRRGWGVPFGAAVWLGAHVITVPAFGLSNPITQSSAGKEATEFGAHLIYGAVVEGTRRFMRANLFR